MTDAVLAGAADSGRRLFYVRMGLVCLGLTVFGFLPTFFVPLAQGTFQRPPIFYVHIALFFAWPVYYTAQAWLAANGRLMAHREWGVLGAALATAMVISVFAVAITRLNQVPPLPEGVPGSRAFTWVDTGVSAYFATCVIGALANTRRPETHRRFMLLSVISIMGAPIARWGPVFVPGLAHVPPIPPTPIEAAIMLPLIYAPEIILAITLAIDRKSDGRLSRVYLIALPVMILLTATSQFIGMTPFWLSVADALKDIAR